MRGIFDFSKRMARTTRFNPAYAGNISVQELSFLSVQVQPRVCGEYSYCFLSSTATTGSTPRMRGIWTIDMPYEEVIRFNPAYAGNIFCSPLCIIFFKVQPRVCGEYNIYTEEPPNSLWFNPAYAGNMPCRSHFPFHHKVQPRVCGEYYMKNL